MTEIHISVQMTFATSQPATDEQFEAFLDEVLVQFTSIGCDVDLSAGLRDRMADFASTVEAPDFATAASKFLGDLRTALHATGCATPGWPQFVPHGHVVRELLDA